MYELHKTWCADTLLSNSVMCAIGVLQHDKQKCWSPKCISSALLEPRPLSICAELIHFGLQHFCLTCCSTPIAHITELDNNVSAHQVLWSSYTFFHLAQKLFEPDGRKRLSFIKVGMNVHWYLVYDSLNIGLLQSQTWQNWKAKTLFSVPTLFTKQINSNSYKAL